MENVMKILADSWCGFEPEGAPKYEDIPADERDNNSWWYLHGKLSEIVHYDKGVVCNCKSGGFAKKTINWVEICGHTVTEVSDKKSCYAMYVNGEVPVEVYGIDEPCIGFFWTADKHDIRWQDKSYPYWQQRGLVCLASDTKACEYARDRMNKKANWI